MKISGVNISYGTDVGDLVVPNYDTAGQQR